MRCQPHGLSQAARDPARPLSHRGSARPELSHVRPGFGQQSFFLLVLVSSTLGPSGGGQWQTALGKSAMKSGVNAAAAQIDTPGFLQRLLQRTRGFGESFV